MTTPPADGSLEPVIGLEVHVQLATRTKLFCGCANAHGVDPNTNVCPVCTGQPGVLPVLNEQALLLGIRAALALCCEIARTTRFDRKNYFYPDLPKGYQVSQLDLPLALAGAIRIAGDDGRPRPIGIIRAHLEEDAGKTIHPDHAPYSLVDLNRAGIPLLEIVSAPDLRSPAEAHRFLVELRSILRYARVSECDMEKGSLRCDANVSVRPAGSGTVGVRTEIKNLNSFRNVERALQFEIDRQIEVRAGGGEVVQETRMWRELEERTESLRSKEESHDYRYFPEPDLPEFVIGPEFVAEIRAALPELPDAKLMRYVAEFGLAPQAAEVLAGERDNAEFYDACVALGAASPVEIANFVVNAILQEANERGVAPGNSGVSPDALVEVVRMVEGGALSRQAARKVLGTIASDGGVPAEVVARLGLQQVSDRALLEDIADRVIAAAPRAVEEYQAGKENALNALVGGVMKATRGQANPVLAREILVERLGR